MATIQQSFETALAKGEIGENIVRDMLEKKGWVVYKPVTDKAHAFDIMAIKDKKHVMAFDVKAKARRSLYPDTGIDERHYQVYKTFQDQHNITFWVVFIDENEKKAYGNEIDKLNESTLVNHNGKQIQYPMVSNGIRYFSLNNMINIFTLDDSYADKLKELSQRNYDYRT